MNFKKLLYTALLHTLRVFIYVKRVVFWVLRKAWAGFEWVFELYSNTLGFYFYKFGFLLKKKMVKYKFPLDRRLVGLLSRRGVLQVILFAVVIVIIFPDSKLYTKELNRTPGRQTLLYSLVGPGDQVFALDDVVIEEADFERDNRVSQNATWNQGAVSAGNTGISKDPLTASELQEIAAISVGGTAIAKPTILPGAEIPQAASSVSGESSSGERKELVEYIVQPGDVIGLISEKYNVDVTSILLANGLNSRSYIKPGQVLKIPPKSGLFHTVVSGNTVNAIANKYEAEVADIIAFNRLQKDGADIVVGEELFIPGGVAPRPVYVPTAPSAPSAISNLPVAPPPSVQAPAGVGYLWPTSVRRITQYFGWRHDGVDIAGPAGSPLYAAKAGTVIKSQCGWNGGYGCYIIIDHGGGVHTLYGHALNGQLYVSVGEQVVQGQTIAAMGSTGRSTGPHVHFEVRVNGRKQNPLSYVR